MGEPTPQFSGPFRLAFTSAAALVGSVLLFALL